MSEPDTVASPPVAPARSRWRRRLVIVGILLLLLVSAPVGGWIYLMRQADRELREAIAELDRREPGGWRLEELEGRRATLDDDDNGALVVMAAKKLLPNRWLVPPEVAPPAEPAEPNEDDPDAPPPFPPLPEPQARHLDELIGELPRDAQVYEPLLEKLRAELKKAEPALRKARELEKLDRGRYPIAWAPDGLSTLLPGLDSAREVARLLSMAAVLEAQDGRADEALLLGRCALNVGRSIGDEPTLISQLVRFACQAIALGSMERTLAQGEPSKEALRATQRLLEDETGQNLLLVGIRGERALMHQLMQALESGKVPLSGLTGPPRAGLGSKLEDQFGPTLARSGHAPILRMLTECVEIAELPPEEQGPRFAEVEQEVRRRKARMRPGDIMVALLLPAVTKVSEAYRRSQANLRCGVTALAAERYRQKHGRWPETLEALVEAGLLDKVPIDPYSGKPLCLGVLKDGVVIYSVGPDGADNGGNLIRDKPMNPGTDQGFRLWGPAHRRQPPVELAPEPKPDAPELEPPAPDR